LGLGSFGGLFLLMSDILRGAPLWLRDYSNIPAASLNLANPITSHFFPQRGFLLGFAVVMAVLVLLNLVLREKRWSWLVPIGVLIGLVPFAHAHSSLVGLAIFLLAGGWVAWLEPAARRWMAAGTGVALLLLTPQMGWFLNSLPEQGGPVFRLGWMWEGQQSLLAYWFLQLGPLLLLIPLGMVMLKRLRNPLLNMLVVGGALLFIMGNLWQFHSYAFDNLKFMLFGLWALLLPLAAWLDRLSRTRWTLVVPLLISLSTIVGLHAIVRDMTPATSAVLFDRDDQLAAADLRDILPTDAQVATVMRHNSMILALAGRRVMCGYDGWLWSYGVDWRQSCADQEQILLGLDDGALAEAYGVTHIAVHIRDGKEGRADLELLKATYRVTYTGHGWAVFSSRRLEN
jgi:hypothetical protein